MSRINRLKYYVLRYVITPIASRFLNPLVWVLAHGIPQERVKNAFARYDVHYLRQHYYLPIPDEVDMSFTRNSELVGMGLDADKAFEFMQTVMQPYKAEFNAFPIHETQDVTQFYLVNGSFMAIDGNAYYGIIRHFKPRRVIEIGSGNSTLLAAAAIRQNVAEGAHQTALISIEPYPMPKLRENIPEITELIVKRVQEVDLSVFEALQENDVLFIDSSHVLKSGNDVWWEFCEILPRLKPGVLVHVHDISLPQPYPMVYYEQGLYWNEQYLLQAFLTYNHRFEVLWPGNYMMVHHPQKTQDAFSPEYQHMREKYPLSGPSSFWMRSVGDGA